MTDTPYKKAKREALNELARQVQTEEVGAVMDISGLFDAGVAWAVKRLREEARDRLAGITDRDDRFGFIREADASLLQRIADLLEKEAKGDG